MLLFCEVLLFVANFPQQVSSCFAVAPRESSINSVAGVTEQVVPVNEKQTEFPLL